MNHEGMAHVAACPYCDHRTPGAESRPEANRRLATHLQSCHRERIEAAIQYRRLIASGTDVGEAQRRVSLWLRSRLEGGSGHYQRRAA